MITLYEEIPNISYTEEYDEVNQKFKETLTENIDKEQRQQLQKDNNILYMKSLIVDVLLPYIWLITSGILVITYILTYITFAIRIKKFKSSENERILFILERCKEKLKINKKVKIIQQNRIKTPSLFGIFNIYYFTQ